MEVLEYNSRIMHVHDIIEIATSLEKKSGPHEVAGGLLHCAFQATLIIFFMSDCFVQFHVLLNFEFVKIRCLYEKCYRNFCHRCIC